MLPNHKLKVNRRASARFPYHYSNGKESMVQQIKGPVLKPHLDPSTGLYQLKFKKIILESDSNTQFYLRKNELQRISERILPMGIKFIIQDETLYKEPELVKVKVILERIDNQEFQIRFEESSEIDRWSGDLAMNGYYEERTDMLRSRQFDVFDLIVETTYADKQCFLIQYSVHIADVFSVQILKLVRKATDAVHNSSEEINNSHFMYLN